LAWMGRLLTASIKGLSFTVEPNSSCQPFHVTWRHACPKGPRKVQEYQFAAVELCAIGDFWYTIDVQASGAGS
jgi:hypothetical protein